ncbi:hypothetical protein D9M72_479870 [compost metagenome]|jgi:hypothetical protein|uniref:hypothetical protein n=1 Tax=Arthrobacter sp. (strain FB24) TaxID=290399 RepID=UPI00030DD09D|nr:hypothetical protein [Arthrobacter sp. FB24]
MSENPRASERVHSEAPAEGDENADPRDIRVHSQEPAEGSDVTGGAGPDVTGADLTDGAAGG